MIIDAGDRVALTFTVDVDGVLTEAPTVKLRVTRPDGVVTTYTRTTDDVSSLSPDGAAIAAAGTGVYEAAFNTDPALPGDWGAKMWSEGVVTAAKELLIRVQA